MKKYREILKEKLKNPEFKKEWDALEEEFRLIRKNLDSNEIEDKAKKNRENSNAFHFAL